MANMISLENKRLNPLLERIFAHFRTPLYRNGYALILSSASTSGLGLLFWAMAARFYKAEIVGLNSAALSTMMFLSGVSQLSLSGVLVRFTPSAGVRTSRLVIYSYVVSVVFALPVVGIFYLGLNIWAPSLQPLFSNSLWFAFFILATMAWSIFTLQDSVLTGLREAVWVPLENSLYSIAKIILLALFASTLRIYGVLAAWTIPAFITLLPINGLIFGRLLPKHARESAGQKTELHTGKIVRYVAGNHLGALFFLAYTTLLPILVTEKVGASANAYFYLPWTIITSLQLVSLNMTMSLTVEAVRDTEKLGLYAYRVLVHTAKLIVPVVAVLIVGAPYILLVFGREYASQGTALLRLLAFAVLPHLIISLSLSLARVKNRIFSAVLIQASLCLLVLGLSVWLLPVYGITGVGIAWCTAYTAVAGYLLFTQLVPLLSHDPVYPIGRL